MDEMTVQAAVDSTDSTAVAADCERAVSASAIPTQDTFSVTAADDMSSLTDGDGWDAVSQSDNKKPNGQMFMPVYKGKVYPMAASDTKDITTLLQLGMKQREMQPLMDDLQLLATQSGAKSIKDFVTQCKETFDAQTLRAAIDAYGEQEGRAYFEATQQQMRQAMEPERNEQDTLKERLAEEFCQLRREFDEYRSIQQLPKEVIHSALTESITLMDALLRYRHRQAQRVQTEKTATMRSAAAATGSLRHTADNRSSSAMDAFLRGLHRRL